MKTHHREAKKKFTDEVAIADGIETVLTNTRKSEFAREQSVSLIETLADRLATHLLGTFAIQKITIELRKFVLEDAKYASVTVTRSASVN